MNREPFVILLVEDDLAHAEIVRRNFEIARVPHQLVHATDGQTALDYLNHEGKYSDPAMSPRPGAVLLDLRLPKVDGLEVLKSIKTHPKLRAIPVVILTTSKAEIDMVKAYDLYANSYLVKPVNFTHFTKLMETFSYYWLAWNQLPNLITVPEPK
jgi:CheY-like chemotaxis protein